MSGATFSLEPGEGFSMWSKYQEGHQGWFRQERAGVFIDKLYAIQALARRDWGLDFTIDENYFINFYDLFPVEMTEFFGGLIQQDPKWYGPRVQMEDGEPQVSHLNWYRNTVGFPTRCTNDRGNTVPCRGNQRDVFPVGELPNGEMQYALEGTTNEIIRDFATIQALSQFPVFFDTSFEQRLSVYKLGNGDGFEIPDVTGDGDAPCAYGDMAVQDDHDTNCSEDQADYVVYESDRFNTPYVAVKVRPRISYNLEEEQLGFQLLSQMYNERERVEELEELESPTDEQLDELERRRQHLRKNESFLEYLIAIQRSFGISSYVDDFL
jgi:hypothetical protein